MKVKDLVIVSIFITLSIILANVRVFASVGLDSIPAFLALLLWRDNKASIIAMFGHMFSAYFSGLTLGLPTHIIIACLMFVMLFFAKNFVEKSLVLTSCFILVVNAFIMPFVIFIFIPFSWEMYFTFVSMLSLAVIVNMSIAIVIFKPVLKIIKEG